MQALCVAHWEATQALEQAAARQQAPGSDGGAVPPAAAGSGEGKPPAMNVHAAAFHLAVPALCSATVFHPRLVELAFLEWLKPRLVSHLQVCLRACLPARPLSSFCLPALSTACLPACPPTC